VFQESVQPGFVPIRSRIWRRVGCPRALNTVVIESFFLGNHLRPPRALPTAGGPLPAGCKTPPRQCAPSAVRPLEERPGGGGGGIVSGVGLLPHRQQLEKPNEAYRKYTLNWSAHHLYLVDL